MYLSNRLRCEDFKLHNSVSKTVTDLLVTFKAHKNYLVRGLGSKVCLADFLKRGRKVSTTCFMIGGQVEVLCVCMSVFIISAGGKTFRRHQMSTCYVAMSSQWATLCPCKVSYIRSSIVCLCVCACVDVSPGRPAFRRAELHMPTSLQSVHMADMRWSVEEGREQSSGVQSQLKQSCFWKKGHHTLQKNKRTIW